MKKSELETLYRDHFQKVYNYVYYRVLDPAVAEDVTSDVFVKVVTHFNRFDPSRASFSTWVMTIAHNAARFTTVASSTRLSVSSTRSSIV